MDAERGVDRDAEEINDRELKESRPMITEGIEVEKQNLKEVDSTSMFW